MNDKPFLVSFVVLECHLLGTIGNYPEIRDYIQLTSCSFVEKNYGLHAGSVSPETLVILQKE